MLDTPDNIHETIESLNQTMKLTEEESKKYENEDFSYLDDGE